MNLPETGRELANPNSRLFVGDDGSENENDHSALPLSMRLTSRITLFIRSENPSEVSACSPFMYNSVLFCIIIG